MSVTRTAVFIGIMCAAWMTSPLTANAVEFQSFVGLSDKGLTKVKKCAVDQKGATERYSSGTAFGVGLKMGLLDGDGLDHDDNFDAVTRFGATDTPLFSGAWSRINERDGVVTYQLTPSGDLSASPPSGGWEDLLNFINAEAGDACLKAPPVQVYEDLSDFVKGTLVVEDKDPKCASSTDPDDIDCVNACGGGSCMKAKVNLDVRAFMNDDETDAWAEARNHWVRFRYKAKGYVVGSNPP